MDPSLIKVDPLDCVRPPGELMQWAKGQAAAYQSNDPYPHIVLDNFLPPDVAQGAYDVFPGPDEDFWLRTQIDHERKLSSGEELSFPHLIRNIMYALNTASVLRFLGELTGIEGLIADSFFEGGGIHQITPGGKLGVHVDFNRTPNTHLYRRVNLLVYLNPDWKDEWGGHLELWDAKGKACRKKVAPVFNRCVIFSTSSRSYHGHPHPLMCPEGQSRKSLALYYYTAEPPKEQKSFVHGTVFMDTSETRAHWKTRARKLVSDLSPPIVMRGLKSIAAQFGVDR